MRHVFASRPVSARALGMREPPSAAGLGNGLPPRAGHAVVHEGRNLRRSKSGRDHNNYKSAPGPDTQRTETTSPIQRRHGRIGRRHVDERPAFRNIDRTCVPGTVWGTASNRTAKSRSTPCLSLRRPSLPQHPPRRQDAITRHRINLSHAPSSSRQTQKKPPSLQPRHLCADFHRHRHPIAM